MGKRRKEYILFHNEEDVKRDIKSLENFLNRNRGKLTKEQLVDYENNLFRRKALLEEMKKNREDFKFSEDIKQTNSELEIDKEIRNKYREMNYRGFISRSQANEEIEKLNK